MEEWSFLTSHARALICITHDPGVRLRDIAAQLAVTERSAYGIVNDLAAAGYVVKNKDGRRNRYEIQGHLPLKDALSREPTIGEVLDILVDTREPVLAQGGRGGEGDEARSQSRSAVPKKLAGAGARSRRARGVRT